MSEIQTVKSLGLTEEQREAGALAVRKMSLEAQWFYEASAPFDVYEVEGEEAWTIYTDTEMVENVHFKDYYVDGFGDLVGPLSFNEVDGWLADMFYDSGMDELEEYAD